MNNTRIYIYLLDRNIYLVTTNINKVYDLAIRYNIGEPYLGGWRRINIWEDGYNLKTITVNGNRFVEMPKNEEELWVMLNE